MIAEIALWTPAVSTTGHRIDQVFLFLVALCGSMGLFIALLLIGFCIRYRRRASAVGNPEETVPPPWLEWGWTITPAILLVSVCFWSGTVYIEARQPPPEATPIYMVGKQWMWKVQHPEGQREINTLHVPVNRPVKLIFISEDVIHSFYVPAFRLHQDVLPARYTTTWFEATEPGSYHLFCSQYCGTNHSGMVGEVIVMEPANYQRWLTETADGSLAKKGEQVFLKYRCLSCHHNEAGSQGPNLEELYGRRVPLNNGEAAVANEAYIRESILNPSRKIVAGHTDIMPSFQGQISEEEIIAFTEFLKQLGSGETPRRVEDFPPPPETPPITSASPRSAP
jgi:cytochrome c oxidase subunit 2